MHNAKVNIIILNWNGADDTITCVKSIQDSGTAKIASITVIDNGSSDDSVVRIKKAHPEIKLIQNEDNLGFGGGCNIGLSKSIKESVDFVWLLNNDTTINPDSLKELLATADSDDKIGIVGSVIYSMADKSVIQTWGGGHINFWTGSAKYILSKQDKSKLQYITGASMLIRINTLRDIGVFDDASYFMYWEDADLCFRAAQKGWRLAVAEKSRILHKESASFKDNHHLLVRYFNQSAVMFFCKFYRFCIIPAFIGLSGRTIKRIIYKDDKGLKEIVLILRQQLLRSLSRIFR